MRYAVLGVALIIGALAGDPKIEAVGNEFIVTFKPGAVYACTVYQQQVVGEKSENFPDGRYTPRHCWLLDETMTGYHDDWDWIKAEETEWIVWAEVGYPKGEYEVEYVETNRVKVQH